MANRRAWTVATALAFALLAGCKRAQNEYKAPPPPEVTVTQPQKQDVTDYLVYTGRTEGVEQIEIRARVEGFVEGIHFRAGQRVMPGDLLFSIDPRPFAARLAETKAELAGVEAELELTEVTLDRAKSAFEKQAVSEIELRQNVASRDKAAAAVALAKAKLDAAMLDVEFTKARSPIPGIVSRNYVDVGALVGKGEPTLLATVIANDKIYAYFDVSENDLLQIMRDKVQQGERRGDEPPRRRVLLTFTDGGDEVVEGVLDAIDNRIDSTTGTLRCRAVFENSGSIIIPGVFVRVKVEMWRRPAVMAPEIAIGADQAGRFVLVVSEDGTVQRRSVTLGELESGSLRRIEQGLNGDEWIVVNGVQRARPGSKVAPVRAPSAGAVAPDAPPNQAAAK